MQCPYFNVLSRGGCQNSYCYCQVKKELNNGMMTFPPPHPTSHSFRAVRPPFGCLMDIQFPSTTLWLPSLSFPESLHFSELNIPLDIRYPPNHVVLSCEDEQNNIFHLPSFQKKRQRTNFAIECGFWRQRPNSLPGEKWHHPLFF